MEARQLKRIQARHDDGDATGLRDMGTAYWDGSLGVAVDQLKGMDLWEQARAKGDRTSALRLGALYYEGQEGLVEVDYVKSFNYFLEWGARDKDAAYQLSVMYDLGQGTQQNPQESLKYEKIAAERGHPQGRHNLGIRYVLGQGTTRDTQRGIEMLETAGTPQSHMALGHLYLTGQVGAVDLEKAKSHLEEAKNDPTTATSAQALLDQIQLDHVKKEL